MLLWFISDISSIGVSVRVAISTSFIVFIVMAMCISTTASGRCKSGGYVV